MRVVITGAAGFLGQKLARKLCEKKTLAGADGSQQAITELVLFDVIESPKPDAGGIAIEVMTGDMTEAAILDKLFAKPADSVFHLAAVVSSQAEADYELGMRVNFDGTRALLDACRKQGNTPRFVMPASVAVMGGDMPDVIQDDTAPTPTNSYGTEKAMCELLINDCSRRKFVDGRVVRLPTITVRPGKPNLAASSFASGVIREPMQGDTTVVPVPKDTELWVLSPRGAINTLVHTHELDAAKLGTSRIITPMGLTVTVGEMVEAMRRVAGDEPVNRISWKEDPAIMNIVCGWPGRWASTRAKPLGYKADESIDAIIQAFIDDDMVKA